MSIIGHSIQSGVVNVQIALRDQLAGQSAVQDEDAQRLARIQREEQAAREAVAQTDAARNTTVQNHPRRRQRSGTRPQDGRNPDDESPQDGGHIDVLA